MSTNNRSQSKPKIFSFSRLVKAARSIFEQLPDKRTGDNVTYSMTDAAMGAFSVFFTQSPSFLDFQRTLKASQGCSNTQTLFGMANIPSDNQVRNLLDPVPPKTVFPLFYYAVNTLDETGYLDAYRSFNGDLLMPFDGTRYFSSKKVHCNNCSTTEHNGVVTYSHSVVTPVIVAPGNPRIIPLEPEFIIPQDGHDKQDCENAAAKRWLSEYGPQYSSLGITVLGDDLYCKQPLCEAITEQGMNFILVCKPSSHKTLYDWVGGLEVTGGVKTIEVRRLEGKIRYTDTYRFVNQVPLRDGKGALDVNWCELTTIRDDGEQMYKNAFATNHRITAANVTGIVRDGRARWKVENENNNTLKTKGYNLTHNFGHGKEHLSSLLATLNILSFLFHTVLDMMDSKYQSIRRFMPRKQFFDDLRALTRYFCFDNWDALMAFMVEKLELEVPDTS